jgi:hypothetical protein
MIGASVPTAKDIGSSFGCGRGRARVGGEASGAISLSRPRSTQGGFVEG